MYPSLDSENSLIQNDANKIENVKIKNVKVIFWCKDRIFIRAINTSNPETTSKWQVKINRNKNLPKFEAVDVILVCSNFSNNVNQHDSRALYTFVPNKQFRQLFEMTQIVLKTIK